MPKQLLMIWAEFNHIINYLELKEDENLKVLDAQEDIIRIMSDINGAIEPVNIRNPPQNLDTTVQPTQCTRVRLYYVTYKTLDKRLKFDFKFIFEFDELQIFHLIRGMFTVDLIKIIKLFQQLRLHK